MCPVARITCSNLVLNDGKSVKLVGKKIGSVFDFVGADNLAPLDDLSGGQIVLVVKMCSLAPPLFSTYRPFSALFDTFTRGSRGF